MRKSTASQNRGVNLKFLQHFVRDRDRCTLRRPKPPDAWKCPATPSLCNNTDKVEGATGCNWSRQTFFESKRPLGDQYESEGKAEQGRRFDIGFL